MKGFIFDSVEVSPKRYKEIRQSILTVMDSEKLELIIQNVFRKSSLRSEAEFFVAGFIVAGEKLKDLPK